MEVKAEWPKYQKEQHLIWTLPHIFGTNNMYTTQLGFFKIFTTNPKVIYLFH
jgi:hypothetical protein